MGKHKPVIVNLGCNRRASPAFINVDLYPFPGVDVVTDLNEPWPWKDSTVDQFIAVDLIEHLKSNIHTMNEAWRCLKPGGIFEILVPSTDGRGAYQDPTHVSFWNINSFPYYMVLKQNAIWVSHPWRALYAPHMLKAAFDFTDKGKLEQTEADNSGIIYCAARGIAIKETIFTGDGIPESATMPQPNPMFREATNAWASAAATDLVCDPAGPPTS